MNKSYEWLLNIINSCETSFQVKCCHRLIVFFRQKYNAEEGFGPLYDVLLATIEPKDALLTI